MSHKEMIEKIMKDAGIEKWEGDNYYKPDPNDIVWHAKHGGVEGYSGFFCHLGFDEEGNLTAVGLGE